MVPLTGLEPVRVLPHGILSPRCLPIPPQWCRKLVGYTGIEPVNDRVKVCCLTSWLIPNICVN